jgi:hypothetical protein
MSLNCIDVSNYSGPLNAQQVADLQSVGIKLGIVQSLDSPPGYPAGVTRQQIQALLDGGVAADAYVWLWFDADISDIQRKLDLVRGMPIGRVWLDVEDVAAAKYDQAATEAKVHDALVLCDNVAVTGGQIAGVYSGRWFWTDRRYMGNTTVFSDRDLWDSDYDDVDDTGDFQPYGGWNARAIKQHHGTTTLAGVPNVDLNVLSADELARVEGGGDTPMPDCDYGWQDKKPLVVSLAGELKAVAAQIRAAGNRKYGPVRGDVLPLADAVERRADEILA